MKTIKLKNLILENIGQLEIDFLKENCSDAVNLVLKNDVVFYRGLRSEKHVILQDPSLRYRRTLGEEHTNYFQVVMDETWKEPIQKRSKSVIFTRNRFDALMYGNAYYLFPFNGAKISHGKESDNWYNYSTQIEKINVENPTHITTDFPTLNKNIKQIVDALHINVSNWKGENIESIRKDFKEIDSILIGLDVATVMKELKNSGNGGYLIGLIYAINKFGGIENFIKYIVDPFENGIKTIDLTSNFSDIRKDTEMWTESKCYMIKESQHLKLEDLKNLLKQ